MSREIIDVGNAANDGAGDPLRTAMIKTNNNFAEIYSAGPVTSNVKIANNTVTIATANANLILQANGTGSIVLDTFSINNFTISTTGKIHITRS